MSKFWECSNIGNVPILGMFPCSACSILWLFQFSNPIPGMFQFWECSEFGNVWDCSNFGNVPIPGTLFFQDQTGAVVLSGPGTTPPNIKLRRGSSQVFFSVRPELMKEKIVTIFLVSFPAFLRRFFWKPCQKDFSWEILSNRRVFRDPRETLMKTIFAKGFFYRFSEVDDERKILFRIPCKWNTVKCRSL